MKLPFISSTEFSHSVDCSFLPGSGSLRAALLNATYSSLNQSALVRPWNTITTKEQLYRSSEQNRQSQRENSPVSTDSVVCLLWDARNWIYHEALEQSCLVDVRGYFVSLVSSSYRPTVNADMNTHLGKAFKTEKIQTSSLTKPKHLWSCYVVSAAEDQKTLTNQRTHPCCQQGNLTKRAGQRYFLTQEIINFPLLAQKIQSLDRWSTKYRIWSDQ